DSQEEPVQATFSMNPAFVILHTPSVSPHMSCYKRRTCGVVQDRGTTLNCFAGRSVHSCLSGRPKWGVERAGGQGGAVLDGVSAEAAVGRLHDFRTGAKPLQRREPLPGESFPDCRGIPSLKGMTGPAPGAYML